MFTPWSLPSSRKQHKIKGFNRYLLSPSKRKLVSKYMYDIYRCSKLTRPATTRWHMIQMDTHEYINYKIFRTKEEHGFTVEYLNSFIEESPSE